MFIYVSKGLPKGQMVAMTMNVLKWRPKLGLCFWNSLTCILLRLYFKYTYCLFSIVFAWFLTHVYISMSKHYNRSILQWTLGSV